MMAKKARPFGRLETAALLCGLSHHGYTESGRFGWRRDTMAGLERKGLVVVAQRYTYETIYRLTEPGLEAARALYRAQYGHEYAER
jgi:hypothetical protein